MKPFILVIFLLSLIAPYLEVQASQPAKPPAPVTKIRYYPVRLSCDYPPDFGGVTSGIHHKDPHTFYYFDPQSKAWRVKRNPKTSIGGWW